MRIIILPCLLLLATASAPPSRIAVNQTWSGVSGGTLFSVGYFTPEQERSPEWEAARRRMIPKEGLCKSQVSIRRDVRWLPPIADGEPYCATIVYSISCPTGESRVSQSLDYARVHALLDQPRPLAEANCGEKNPAKRLNFGGEVPIIPDTYFLHWAIPGCKNMTDLTVGKIHLSQLNYAKRRIILDKDFLAKFRDSQPGNFLQFISYALSEEGRRHIVYRNSLEPNSNNIFLDELFTANKDGYCVTLIARQGGNVWQRTIRRDSAPVFAPRTFDGMGHPTTPDGSWNYGTDAHLLEHQLAEYLEIPIPPMHKPPWTKEVPE